MSSRLFTLDSEHSEFCGVIMGDGNIWSNGRKYEITITGDIIKDKEYFDKLFVFIEKRIKKHPYYRIRGRGLRLSIYSKAYYYFIISEIGIPARLEKSNFGIPILISENIEFTKSFIRGLFDTDGSIFTSNKPGVENYPTLEINNDNQTLLNAVYLKLKKLGFRIYYRCCGRGSYKISIYGLNMLKKWKEEIGSSNPHKLRRITSILECFHQ